MSGTSCVYEARGVTKVFGGTTALRDVTFRLRPGEVHALIGENGAGKSTLVRILGGVEPPSDGVLLFEGREVRFSSAAEARELGIGLIHQELLLFPDLSVADNLFAGREQTTRWGAIDARAQEREARAVLTRLGQDLDPRVLVGALPLGLRQIVEIARALAAGTRVLMMDEPTSALTASEIRTLFGVVRDLAARGVAIVYISHHLHELTAIADRVTVLRDGARVGEAPCAEIDVPWIVERMTGRRPEARPPQGAKAAGRVVLEVRGLSRPAAGGRTGLDRVHLQLRAGEIVGIYGLLGAGRTELFESIMGVHAGAAGEVLLEGRAIGASGVPERVGAGMAMVPEDRQAEGLVPTLTVLQNMTLSHLPALAQHGVIGPVRERQAGAALASALRVKTAGLDAPIVSLSGGNQQKVAIARALMPRPRVLLLDEPTRGVDVAAKGEIAQAMRRMAGEGMAVAFASSDLTEILDVADRVIVMARGRVRAEWPASDAREETLASAASVAPGIAAGEDDAVH